MPTYWSLVWPHALQAWKAWDSRAALCATVLFALLTRFVEVVDRARLTRELIQLGAPIAIALIAILLAGFALFSSLINSEFRKAMGAGMTHVTAAFLYSITVASLALVADVLLFAGSFIDSFVQSPAFWWIGQLAFFGFAYTITVVMQSSYELTIIILGSGPPDQSSGTSG